MRGLHQCLARQVLNVGQKFVSPPDFTDMFVPLLILQTCLFPLLILRTCLHVHWHWQSPAPTPPHPHPPHPLVPHTHRNTSRHPFHVLHEPWHWSTSSLLCFDGQDGKILVRKYLPFSISVPARPQQVGTNHTWRKCSQSARGQRLALYKGSQQQWDLSCSSLILALAGVCVNISDQLWLWCTHAYWHAWHLLSVVRRIGELAAPAQQANNLWWSATTF